MIPKLWPGSTIVCIGNGPSSRVWEVEDPIIGSKVAKPHPDLAYCCGRARVLVMTLNLWRVPCADAALLSWMTTNVSTLWFRDNKLGHLESNVNGPAPEVCIMPVVDPEVLRTVRRAPDVCYVRADLHATGISNDPALLHARGAVGYAAINAAVHLGARRIVLLGYDHVPPREYPGYETLVEPLRELGIEVVNASRQTELTVFPRVTIAEALAGEMW